MCVMENSVCFHKCIKEGSCLCVCMSLSILFPEILKDLCYMFGGMCNSGCVS